VFFFRLISTAFRSLDANFLRSLLATLGVVIGVAAVISAMSILEGAQQEVLSKFQSLGSNVLYVTPGQKKLEGRSAGIAENLQLSDIPIVKSDCPEVEAVAPFVYAPQTLKFFRQSVQATAIGTTNAYAVLNHYRCSSGRFLTAEDSASESAAVVVLGQNVSDKLFSGADPVGQPVKVGNMGFRVIGVMEKKGSIGFTNVDDAVFIPVRVAMKRVLRQKFLHGLDIRSRDADKLNECERQVRAALRRAHRIRAGEEEDFGIFNQQQALKTLNEATAIFAIVFYSIAGISLVVGGIGITNIMLVSVTERTKEIGVRIAVGARRGDILFQFLIEALIISAVGGAVGLLLGLMFSHGLAKILPIIKTSTPPKVIITALTVAVVVGLASGIYPAFKASRKDPVEALRYE
jgi:putative ABC transport system permease protein